jgi:hypothetical protein
MILSTLLIMALTIALGNAVPVQNSTSTNPSAHLFTLTSPVAKLAQPAGDKTAEALSIAGCAEPEGLAPCQWINAQSGACYRLSGIRSFNMGEGLCWLFDQDACQVGSPVVVTDKPIHNLGSTWVNSVMCVW